jgi:NADPH2 dehydrogenase
VAGLFDAWKIGDVELKNRIVVSPMCQYMAQESGVTTDWHLVHYGSLALGGAALVFVEATGVEPRGRISTLDVGLYDDAQIPALARIATFAHAHGTRIGIQLNHAGRKADVPEPIVAPSALAFSDHYQTPVALSAEEISHIADCFAASARRAVEAGFDVIEIHAAHGYLLHQFMSPLSNRRSDEFGGSTANRTRGPLLVIDRVLAAVAGRVPVGIRVSGTDYSKDGYDVEELAEMCAQFAGRGLAFIDVSSGGNTPTGPARVYPGYQVGLAAAVKQRVAVPVIAVGLLDDPLLAEHVVQSGSADAIAVARGFLRDKNWGHKAAQALGVAPEPPRPYRRAFV